MDLPPDVITNVWSGQYTPVRIGAGGITATQLQAELAKSHQDAIDQKMASWLNAEADVYDSDGLLKLHHDTR